MPTTLATDHSSRQHHINNNDNVNNDCIVHEGMIAVDDNMVKARIREEKTKKREETETKKLKETKKGTKHNGSMTKERQVEKAKNDIDKVRCNHTRNANNDIEVD